ncbi:hypothetical protein F1880_003415 [Penicillium rolfsii]|nr:hypothetical protein F1880_003415 [Penicillium rolfsii]
MSRRCTSGNHNGNKNRWFYFCGECDTLVFDDWEGIRNSNPLCHCQEFSRGQFEVDRAFVFRCAKNVCHFREEL